MYFEGPFLIPEVFCPSSSYCLTKNERNSFMRVFTAFVFMNDFCLLLSLSRYGKKTPELEREARDKTSKTRSVPTLTGRLIHSNSGKTFGKYGVIDWVWAWNECIGLIKRRARNCVTS